MLKEVGDAFFCRIGARTFRLHHTAFGKVFSIPRFPCYATELFNISRLAPHCEFGDTSSLWGFGCIIAFDKRAGVWYGSTTGPVCSSRDRDGTDHGTVFPVTTRKSKDSFRCRKFRNLGQDPPTRTRLLVLKTKKGKSIFWLYTLLTLIDNQTPM